MNSPSNSHMYCSHNAALSLWQSAVHSVLTEKSGPTASTRRGVGTSLALPQMMATAQLLKHFDQTGNFNLPPAQPTPAGVTAPPGAVLQTASAPAPATAAAVPAPAVECAKLAAQIALYAVTDPAKAATIRQELADSTCDPLWAECLAQYDAWRVEGKSQPYINYTNIGDFVLENCFPDDATIAVIGDWGTGMNDALVLLEQIGVNFKPDVLMHLGDIYYSGLPQECVSHFTGLIDQVWPDGGPRPRPLIFTLDGNHDRYAGANGGYYNLIANLNQAAGKPQPNSYFALRNNFWQFVAMDTGLNDSNPFTEGGSITSLAAQEIPWHLDKIANSAAGVDKTANPSGVRGTVLLSHHQLFSFTGVGKGANCGQMAVNPNLVQAFSPVFHLIDVWLWGHEHALCIFEPYANGPGQPLPKGRCVGASAVPVYLAEAPAPPSGLVLPPGASGAPRAIDGTALGNNGTVFNYCYAIVRLAGASLSIDYYQVDSTNSSPGNPPALTPPLYSETIARPLAAG